MASDAPNPYESPREPPSPSQERFVRRYLPIFAVTMLSGAIISAVDPFVGVPLTLIAIPALVRATRIYWRQRRAAAAIDFPDRAAVLVASLFVVLPLSLVGGIAFCCVCTPTGYVALVATYPGGDTSFGIWIYAAIYLGLGAGIFTSLFMLKRLHYMTRIETTALDSDESADRHVDHDG